MSRRLLLVALVGLAVSAASIALLVATIDIGAASDLILEASLLPLVIAAGLLAITTLLRSLRWSLLLAGGDARRPRVVRILPVLLVGYLGNTLLPGRLGEVLRAYLIARRERLEASRALGTVVLERLIDVATLGMVALAATTLLPAPSWFLQLATLAAVGALAVVGVLVIIDFRPFVRTVRWPSNSLRQRAGQTVGRFAAGAGGQHKSTLGAAFALSASCWLIDGTIFWLVGVALGTGLVWPAAMLISSVSVLSTAIPSAPGYVGTYHLVAVGVAVALGVPAEQALAVALLAHAMLTGLTALGGAVSAAVMSVSLTGTIRHVALGDRKRERTRAIGTQDS